MELDPAITQVTKRDIYMPIIDSSSSHSETTNHKQSMPTSIWTGTMCYRFLLLLSLKMPHVQYAFHTQLHHGWLNVAISSVCHASFDTCTRPTRQIHPQRRKLAGRSVLFAGTPFSPLIPGLSDGILDRKVLFQGRVMMWSCGWLCESQEAH